MNPELNSNFTYQNFSKLESVIPIPDLLDIQLASFEDFLQEDVLPEKREIKGLEAVFKNMFPVEDTHRNYVLEYKHYYLGLPKYKVKECLERMGYDYYKDIVSIPAYRSDVLHQIDLVEDIAIAYGYENFNA